MQLSTRTRRAIAAVLAVTLAVESASVVIAAAGGRTATHPLPADPPAGQVLAAEAAVDARLAPLPARIVLVAPRPIMAALPPEDLVPSTVTVTTPDQTAAADEARERAERRAERRAEQRRERQEAREAAREAARREARADAQREQERQRQRDSDGGGRANDKDKPSAPSYKGRNHVWMPALGISKSVQWFPCERQREPDNYMYRWGCAGTNNVYLMGHAYSVMKPLHDAYVNGRLNKGMKVWYADNNSRVRVYAVRWWKVTKPTTDAAWAWAPQDVPSMTLQTCVGRNSQYRLMVRLTEVN